MPSLSKLLQLRKNTVIQAVGIYTFSNFFNKGVSFLLLFYFTHVLAESDFGLLNLFSNSILFLTPFVSMGILHSANSDFFKLDKKDFRDFFTTTMLLPLLVTLLAVIVLFFFRHSLHRHYTFPNAFILLIPVFTFFNFLNEHLINMVRNNNEPLKYLVLNIGRLLVEITLAVFFISALNQGWIGRVNGMFISYLLIAVYAFIYFKQKGFIFGAITPKYIYDELVYSIPIIVMQISIFCISSSGGYFIEYFTRDYSEVGIYSVAVTFASIIIVFCSALLHYIYPRIFSLLSEKEINYVSLRKNFLYYAGGLLLCTVLVIAATPIAYAIVLKRSYIPGLRYYYLICIGFFFWTITYFFYSFMLYHKMKRKILYLSLISIVISLAGNYFFVKSYGSFGAAVSILTGYALTLGITILSVKKEIMAILQGSQRSTSISNNA